MTPSLTSPAYVRSLMDRHGLRLKKALGQNFLVDVNVLKRIVEVTDIGSEDGVLEIGAGIGTLTRALAGAARKVVSLEIDAVLLPVLEKTVGDLPNVRIIHQDFLTADLPALAKEHFGGDPVHVAANLPYYITSPVLEKLLAHRRHFSTWTLLVQKEVARRLIAGPGTKDYGALTVFVQYAVRPRIALEVPRTVFMPAPQVDSSVVRFETLPEPSVQVADESLFFAVVRGIFQMRRKTLLNALSGAAGIGLSRDEVCAVLAKAGIGPMTRGETLSLPELARLADAVHAARRP
ncbi:MAG: 16S rRNA (adenine(1518)-N(6)/adenine(1519)-N(6))-dimethyltransferase RsmA [Armatimonadetes bacterium]|nr:16S rRNA (adenine(1518)-N(6)/adenine(1519)-N(6))-dimethyltransferase RsmA [Armatimonadota bacterium]